MGNDGEAVEQLADFDTQSRGTITVDVTTAMKKGTAYSLEEIMTSLDEAILKSRDILYKDSGTLVKTTFFYWSCIV